MPSSTEIFHRYAFGQLKKNVPFCFLNFTFKIICLRCYIDCEKQWVFVTWGNLFFPHIYIFWLLIEVKG